MVLAALVTQVITAHLPRNQTASNTGEQMGDVDLNSHYQMEDQANVTQMEMEQGKGLAVPHINIVETVMPTANVLGASTSDKLLRGVVSISLSLPASYRLPISHPATYSHSIYCNINSTRSLQWHPLMLICFIPISHFSKIIIKYLDVGPQAQLPPPYAEDISALLTIVLS